MMSNPVACEELVKLVELTAEDGVSLIAIDEETNKIVGASFNKLQMLSNSNNSFFENFRDNICTQENSISLINFMIEMDAQVDLFKLFNVECSLEIMFLAVIPEYGGKGIGKMLVENTLSFIELIQKNNDDCSNLPKLATGILTSKYSYKIFKDLNFIEVFKKEFSDCDFNGKWKYSDKVDCNLHDQGLILMVKKI